MPHCNAQPDAITWAWPDSAFAQGERAESSGFFVLLISPFPAGPSPSLDPLLSLKQGHFAKESNKNDNRRYLARFVSPEGGSKEPDFRADWVRCWQDLLRSEDGFLCQGLFVCLQERIIWHSTEIVTKAWTRACLFQYASCKIGS